MLTKLLNRLKVNPEYALRAGHKYAEKDNSGAAQS